MHTHTHTQTDKMEYYSDMEKNEILSFVAAWMDLEGIRLSKISQTERKILYDITYMWNVKKNIINS